MGVFNLDTEQRPPHTDVGDYRHMGASRGKVMNDLW